MTALRSAISILFATPIGWALMTSVAIGANALSGVGV